MKARLIIFIATMAVLLTGCDKAPDGVIKESKLADFLYDLYRLEAIIEMNHDRFPTDSTKRVAKQSLFLKHGITQADYDSSLVWYATNFEAYSTVHKKVVLRLQEDRNNLAEELATGPRERQHDAGTSEQRRTYAAKGDTADIWTDERTFMLTSGLKRGYITFECEPDGEHRRGDRYALGMKMLTFGNTFTLMLAAEYSDGSVAVNSRYASLEGWTDIALQTDSTRNVRRIFGYISYNLTRPGTVTFVDSIALLRTHLDRKLYSNIRAQKFIDRRQQASKANSASKASSSEKPNGSSTTSQKGGPAETKPIAKKLYAPKPGVNKSGVIHRTAPPKR
ncbi:MAG: DUF4296 domain-containing protein [Bacteroidales bacterium]|nr:DUF4296 domain-containing protein [Bacteroidales bacterium]